MPPSTDDYGLDRFIWKNGQRLRIWMSRSILPAGHETNAQFEARMNQLAETLAAMDGILGVELVFERRAGHIAQCVIEVAHEPRPAAVVEDSRPAGGHFGAPRGVRGGSKVAA